MSFKGSFMFENSPINLSTGLPCMKLHIDVMLALHRVGLALVIDLEVES